MSESSSDARPSALVRADRRPPRVGVPAVLVHQGDGAGGRPRRRRARAAAGDAGARRRVRARAPRPRAGPAGDRRPRHRHLADRSSSWPRRDAPPGATFERLDARALAFDAEFDAVICLCQGAFGLMTAGGEDGTVVAGIARALRPGGRLALSAFNAYFAVRYHEAATFDAATGVSHERTEVRDPDGTAARGRPVDRVLHAPRAAPAARPPRPRRRPHQQRRARCLRRRPADHRVARVPRARPPPMRVAPIAIVRGSLLPS